MNAVPHVDGRKRWKYCFGGMLCCLLLVYAVGAKLALYHLQQPGAKSVAATKAWQNNAIPSVDVGSHRFMQLRPLSILSLSY